MSIIVYVNNTMQIGIWYERFAITSIVNLWTKQILLQWYAVENVRDGMLTPIVMGRTMGRRESV